MESIADQLESNVRFGAEPGNAGIRPEADDHGKRIGNTMTQTEQFELTINGSVPDWTESICEGFVCESLHIKGEPPVPANVSYLKFNGAWFRLYFEFRCVFWRSFEGQFLPWNAEAPWTEYVDLADELKIVGQRLVSCVASATAKGSVVAFVFESGLTVLIQDRDDRTSFEITYPLQTGSLD